MTETASKSIMRPADLCLYLLGNRRAIERIAATPWSWVVGAVLVLSAGIARNYDHLDLLRQPSWFIGPFAASLFSSGFVFIWVYPGVKLHKLPEKGGNYLVFLNLIWLTAPCAWIYGLPVESFTDLVTATKWNIAFLAIVSIWRVALIIRAVCVLTRAPWPRVSLLVIAPASLEMMFASFFKGMSLVGIMGGVRLPPHDQLLREVTGFTAAASFWIFIAAVIALFFIRGRASASLSRASAGFPKSALGTAVLSLLVWIAIAIPVQPRIQNRHRLEQFIDSGNIEAAIAFASSKNRGDFPSIHYLAPDPSRYQYGYPLEPLEKLPDDAPSWLREEWTRNAIEAHKSFFIIDEERLAHLKTRHPRIFSALLEYEVALKAKPELTPDEKYWLERFGQAKSHDG
jgi:hypothetical protein